MYFPNLSHFLVAGLTEAIDRFFPVQFSGFVLITPSATSDLRRVVSILFDINLILVCDDIILNLLFTFVFFFQAVLWLNPT